MLLERRISGIERHTQNCDGTVHHDAVGDQRCGGRRIANLRSEVAFGNDWQRPPKGVDIRRESKLALATRQFGRFPAKADEMSTNLHVKLPKMNRSCQFWAAHW